MRKGFTATVLMLLTALLCLSGSAYAQKKSKKKASAQAKSGVMPAWEKGYLDIHFISTNTGESYYIYSLSDKDESMNINERFGPYKSR